MDIEFGIGPGVSAGTLWMTSADDGLWYEVNISGSSGSATVYVNQTPLALQDSSLGYQLLIANDSNVYPVYLTGTAGSVAVEISQSAWGNPYDYKPHLFLKSITDGCFYVAYASESSGTITLEVDQNSKISLDL